MPVILEDYQIRVRDEIAEAFSDVMNGVEGAPEAVVLKAPTASGKTLMMARGLSKISESGAPAVWFWLAPFDNIVTQTEKVIRSEAGESLRPRHLGARTWLGHRAGDVWLSTAALASSSKAGPAEDTEFLPSLRSMAEQIRSAGLNVGVVIDEAHLNAKEKGKFIDAIGMLSPDIILAASATPKDEALDKFFVSLGVRNKKTLVVDREEAVSRHLNKKGLWATIVEAQGAGEDASLEFLVRATWQRHLDVEAALAAADLKTVPLALFQAENDAEGERMVEAVKRGTGLDEKDIAFYGFKNAKETRSLNDIADDHTVRALVFKVAAGTGFDAPRAFCLGSARTVRDETSAAQFIGRIMRVPREVRAFLFQNPDHPSATILNNAHLFLIDKDSQTGFRTVIQRISGNFAAAGLTDISFQRLDADGLVSDDPFEGDLEDILNRAGVDGCGYESFDDLNDALGSSDINIYYPRHDAFRSTLPREEWRRDADMSSHDVIDRVRGVIVTPQRVRDRIDRAMGVFTVTQDADDLNTVHDENVESHQRLQAARAAKSDFTNMFSRSISLIPGFDEAVKTREFLAQTANEVISTGLVSDVSIAVRIAMILTSDYHAEIKTAVTKGDGAGRVRREGAPLPDAYISYGAGTPNSRMAYGYHFRKGAQIDAPERLSRFMKNLAELGMNVDGKHQRIDVSDKTMVLNDTELKFVNTMKTDKRVLSILRNPEGKSYSCCYANVAGQGKTFYPDFVVALQDGRLIAFEPKYDRKNLREKITGRGVSPDELPVIFVIEGPGGIMEIVEGYDDQGVEVTRKLDIDNVDDVIKKGVSDGS